MASAPVVKPKKSGPAKQADALETPAAEKTSGLTRGTAREFNQNTNGYGARETLTSDTPALDEQRKAKRIQTLTDEQVLAKAKDGYADYSVEARRRKLKGYDEDTGTKTLFSK